MSDAVLVTGSDGFIGRALVDRLRDAGRHVIAHGRAFGDIARDGAFDMPEAVESVIHLAARTFVPASWDQPVPLLQTNVMGTARVLEFCRSKQATLVYVSAYLYGEPERLPISESAPIRPNNPYALSKHLAEQLCRFYAENLAVPATIIRPFNAYGPGQDRKFLIPKILEDVRDRHAIEVEDLEPRRDLVFIDDLIEAIATASARKSPAFDVFNIGSGASHSVAEIIATIQEVAGTNLEVKSRGSKRRNEISDVVADTAHARNVLGWEPRVSLTEGIRQCWLSFTGAYEAAAAGPRIRGRLS